jgi:hypothetical protein
MNGLWVCRSLCVLVMLGSVWGCSVGPDTIPRDRFSYGDAISTSWKSQTLLNIVKIRYHDPPTFLGIRQVVNQYSLQTRGTVSGDILNQGYLGQIFRFNTYADYYDRPTITYTPRQGDKFTRDILMPVPPHGVLALTQSGWSSSVMFRLTVESINGVSQTLRNEDGHPRENPAFEDLLEDLDYLQTNQLLITRLIKKGRDSSLRIIFKDGHSVDANQALARVYEQLGLDPSAEEFGVVFGAENRSATEIAIQTRSILGMMTGLSDYVYVPDKHLASGWTTPGWQNGDNADSDVWPFRVRSGPNEPMRAFAKVRYEGNWFWIDKHDLASKQMLAALMLVATIAESPGSTTAPPFLTLPAG